MENYPSNAHGAPKGAPAPATERPKVTRIVTDDAIQRKTPLGKRIKNYLIGGDSKSVAGYVISSVLIPAAQDALTDAVKEGIEKLVYGETSTRSVNRGAGRSNGAGNVEYNKFGGGNKRPDPRANRRTAGSHDIGENILNNRGQAEAVLDQMYDVINKYGQVSVSDFYEMIGVTGTYTDEKWGWVDLTRAGIARARGGGFVIDLPRPEPLT